MPSIQETYLILRLQLVERMFGNCCWVPIYQIFFSVFAWRNENVHYITALYDPLNRDKCINKYLYIQIHNFYSIYIMKFIFKKYCET